MVIAKRGYLVPGPFRVLLHELCALNPADDADGVSSGWSAIAAQVGVDEARVRIYAGVSTYPGASGLVKVETVDRVLIALGYDMAGVYGPMYEAAAMPERDHKGKHCVQCGEPLREPALLCGFCMEEGRQS